MVRKHVIELTVLSEASLDGLSLGDIAQLIDTGPGLGRWSIKSETELTDPETIRREAEALGNDGDFFLTEDEE